jgi:ABC-type antimicrobial peptide transport system permease subunit
LITQALATHFGGAHEALGTRFRLGTRGDYSTVVGVVENVKLFGLDDRWGPEGIIDLVDPGRDHTFVSFSVRTERDPAEVIPELRAAVRQIDPEQPIYVLATLADELWESVARPRFFAVLMAIFAGLALVLASAGLYGVLSFAVSQRIREMGIRMALGAGAREVRAMVLSSGLRLGALGAVVGVGISLWGAGLVEDQLFGTSARDLPTLAAVALVMLVVTALSSAIPARRATRVDVVEVLRAE